MTDTLDTLADLILGNIDGASDFDSFSFAVDLRDSGTITQVAWIGLADRLDICPVHAHDVEICQDDELVCPAASYAPQREQYIEAVKVNWDRIAAPITCTECGQRPAESEDEELRAAHVLHEGKVIVGCEGYWIVDPNTVGILSSNWEPTVWEAD